MRDLRIRLRIAWWESQPSRSTDQSQTLKTVFARNFPVFCVLRRCPPPVRCFVGCWVRVRVRACDCCARAVDGVRARAGLLPVGACAGRGSARVCGAARRRRVSGWRPRRPLYLEHFPPPGGAVILRQQEWPRLVRGGGHLKGVCRCVLPSSSPPGVLSLIRSRRLYPHHAARRDT